MIKIYDIDDKLLMQAEVTSAAKREQELSKSDYISLSFSAAEKVILPVGAYINYTYKIDKVREVTRKFLLLESYEPIQTDECSWKYTPQFQHPKMILSKTPFFIYTRNSQNVEIKQNVWSFVGTTSVLSGKIADFLNKDLMFGECGWKVFFQNVTANTINVSFSDNDFISALTAITNAIGDNCEWHIDYDDEIIYIGKVLIGVTPVVLEVGKNVGVPNISNSKESYYNAFSIFGGTRNITQVNSKGENISSGDIRLQLNESNGTISIDGKERSYSIDKYSTLDLRADKTKEPLFTKVLDFSQIFPSLNTYVYNVRGRVKYVLDKNNNKIPISNADGSIKEYKTFTVWYMRLAYPTTEKVEGKTIINTTVDNGVTHYWYDFEIIDNLLIKGKNIGCSFEPNFNTGALSTPLAGRGTNGDYVGFELTYHKEASSSHSSDDVSASNFSILAGDYEIIYQEDNEVIIPTNAADMLIPRGESMPSYMCNITVLYNIAMAKSIYKEDAQKRLLDAAIKEIKRLLSDLNNYSVKSYPQVFEAENPCLQIGQKVVYNDGNGYQLNTRVRKISTNIDFEFVQEITVGNEVIKGNTAQLREDVKEIIASGSSGSGGGGNYTTSQLRNLISRYGTGYFVSKLFDDTVEGMITFIKGLVSKGLADLKMGAKFGNNAMITQLGEAVLSAIKSLDYDNAAEQGFSVEKEKNGKYHAFVTNLTIWGKAIFHELEVRKLSYSGGNIYLSGAGSKLIKVVPVKKLVSDGGVTSWVETTEDDVECVGWKCYLLADDGTTATMNYWQEGDQVRCQTIGEIAAGGAYSDVSNKSYWRTIPDGGVSTQNEKIYGTTTETYLDEVGKEQTREVQVELYGGQSFAWIVVGKHSADFDGYTEDSAPVETKDIPTEGDTIVLDGNRHRNKGQEYDKTDRQNVIILETTGEYAPRIACYANISEYKHTFVKSVNGENKEVSLSVFETSPKGGTKINSSRFEWISDDGSTINIINYRGDWVSGNKYHKNDQVNHNNAVWVCVANSGVDVSEEPSDGSSNWKKVLSGGKGEKGDDAVSYSVQFSIVNDTVNGVMSQRLYVTFTKSVGSNITSGTIGKIGFYGRAKVYLDGEENGVMSSELSRDYPYIDIGDKGHADTIKGKKNLSVELIDANGKIVASNTFFFAEKGDKGDKGENAIRLALTNENSSVSCDKNGNPLGTVQGTIAILYDGAVAANADRVTYSIVSYDGLSVMPEINAGGAIDNIEIRGGNTSLKASINIKAVYENQAYYATYTITKVLAGSDGTPAIIYWIEPSATAIKVDSDGNANPSTITCKQYKQVGAESPVAGDKKIYYRHNAMDSTLWNEYTEAINPATNVDAYEFVLADKTPSNSSAIIYDRESIPVIKDGQNGNDGLSGNGIVPAYIRSKDNPTPPTSTDKNNLDNGWSLAIPSVADVKNVSYSDSSWTDYSDDSYTWKKSPTTAANSTSWCLVTFTTTQANQTVMFVIKSFSEKKYDYIFLSEIDASNVPSKPGFAGASRAVSGNGVELSITDVVATAGTHTVYICYGKDASGDNNGDYGLFRIESMAGIPLWQSNGKEVFTREDNGTIKSKIESWSEPFKVTGENGEDAVSYTVTLTRGSNGITQGLYVGVTRYIGTACTTGTIIDFGMSCKAYTDGTLAEGLTDRLQTSDNYIDFAAFPKAKSFTVELFDKNGNKVATGNYSSGDDAISILVEDAPLVFDTDDSGTVPASVTKTAKVKVMKGNTNVANDCTQLSSRDDLSSNCMCNVGKDEDNGCISVSVQGNWISKNDVIVDGVNQGKVSATSGYAVAQFVYAGVVYFAQVPFSVNVAKFTGSVVANNKKFEINFTEISNRFKNTPTNNDLTKAESRITQTAREISLSVSEKSVGRRNMLVGSACRKYGDGFVYMSGGYYDGYPLEQIEKNSGINGVNCIHCRTKQTGTDIYYLSGFRWYGVSPQGNIKLQKGKNYVLSFYAKTHTPNDIYFHAEVLYQGSKIDTSRPAGHAGPTGYSTTFAASEADKWELFTVKVSVPSNAKYEYVEINIFARGKGYSFVDGYICKPMLEEGENYNGWTLSEQDYDYVGGNLLDNARTLDKSGTLIETYDTVIQNGYGTDSACIKNLMKANATPSDYKEVLRWRFGSTYLFNGNDYIFSFVAKADVDDARVVCYMWSGDIENLCNIFTEGNGGAWDSQADGKIVFILSRQWTRYWVHWRPKDGYATPKEVIIRHTGNNSTSASTVYVTQPKLEIGATMTEWTERKSDLVDKASLKKAGIGITDKEVLLYGEQVKVMNNNVIAALFKNGMLNADLIAAKVLESLGSNGARVVINDGIMEFFGSINKTQPNIRFGLNSEGSAVLSYYDNAGNFLYDLGPDGISTMDKQDGIFTEYSFYTSQNLFGITSIPSSYGTMKTFESSQGTVSETFYIANEAYDSHLFPKLNPSRATVTHLYRYKAPRINGKIVADSKNGLTTQELASKADSKYFTSNRNVVFNGNLTNLAVGEFWNIDSAVTNMGNFVSALLKYGESYTKPTYSRSQQMTLIDGSSKLGIVSRICSLETTTQYGGNIHAGWE